MQALDGLEVRLRPAREPSGVVAGLRIHDEVGRDALPWGEPVVVVERFNAGTCSVGWNGEEFLVLYNLHGGDSAMWVQRIRPRI